MIEIIDEVVEQCVVDTVKFGDCRQIMDKWVEDGIKIQMCVTSPPYYGLRDYGTANWEGGDLFCDHSQYLGGHGDASKKQVTNEGTQKYWYRGSCKKCGAVRTDDQLGLEETPQDYVDNMVSVFRSVRNLLSDDGTLWLNIGDSYAANRSYQVPSTKGGPKIGQAQAVKGRGSRVPDGLKPKDLIGIPWMLAFALRADGWYLRQDIIWQKPNAMPRPDKDRCVSSHEHIFLLSKSKKYYFDYKAIQETATKGAAGSKFNTGKTAIHQLNRTSDKERIETGMRNKRDVWSVTTKPYKGAHFATFPADLIEPCILAGSRLDDIVFDPFMGSGTTAQVALKNYRHYLGCELNKDYESLIKERLDNI